MNIEKFIKDLKDPESSKRMQAAENLGKIEQKEAIDPLISSINDTNGEVRYAIVKALDHYNGDRISNILLQLLKDNEWYVRFQSGLILEKKLNGKNLSILEFLYNNDPHKLSKLCAASALIALDQDPEKKYFKFILNLLNDDDNAIRIQAVNFLSEIGDQSSVEKIIEEFNNQNKEVKLIMISILSKFQNNKIENWLIGLIDNADPDFKEMIIKGLGNFNSDLAVSQLIKLLDDDNSYIKSLSAITLGNLGNSLAIEPLIKKLDDPDQDVVFYSKEALSKIGI
ncbi:MAG: HEAT repeat domain-containing protein [Spirochaetota bacterium]|nr:HEAT repeat domain-containing protein [Spirochaetota bacterium]